MKNYEIKEFEQTLEQKIREYEIKITGMEAEICLLKMRLNNAESKVMNQMTLRCLDKLTANMADINR